MKADVQSQAEKEALEWAIQFFRLQAKHFTHKGRAERAQEIAEFTAAILFDDDLVPPEVRPQRLSERLANAVVDGNELSIKIMCELAIKYLELEKPLPSELRTFLLFHLRYPGAKLQVREGQKGFTGVEWIKPKPGPGGYYWLIRNYAIVHAIERIMFKWKFQATRSPATKELAKRASAASIVCEGIELGREEK